MRYGWDEAKRRANIKAHGVDFAAMHGFAWDFAAIDLDDREDYGELREKAVSFIGATLYVAIFTRRTDPAGPLIWMISLRQANRRERRDYARATQD